jgi:hypothetical protein
MCSSSTVCDSSLFCESFWHRISNATHRLIRITTRKEENDTIITIDGQVTEKDLTEIRRVRKALKGAVALNLRGLDVCLPSGIRLLREWLDAGARLQDATPFLEMTLKDMPAMKRSPPVIE